MPSGFHQLLIHLDPDPVCAGERYEQLRRTLVRYFAVRAATYPEDEADETIHRLAGMLELGLAVIDIDALAHGIARLVRHESRRRHRRLVPLDGDRPIAAIPQPSEAETRTGHLQHCLDALPRESRELLLAYYSGGEGVRKIEARRRLARQRDLPPSTLRSQVQRLRERVEGDLRRLHGGAAPAPSPAARADRRNVSRASRRPMLQASPR